VKQDGIFGTHVKPEKKISRQPTTSTRCVILHSLAMARARSHTKIYLPTPASPPLMDVELSNW
jgi:hypothetical protein